MVTALKVSATPSFRSVCSAGAEIAASVKMNDSIVAMSGAIMPAPLAMPLIVTLGLADLRRRGRHLGEGVGGHDRLALRQGIRRRCARATRPSMTPSKACAFSGSPITPVEARNTSSGLQPAALRGDLRGELAGIAAGLAGEGIGVAGIDHQRAGLARLQMRAAPLDRRRRAFRAREHARRGRAGIEQRQQDIGALRVADAGLGGREPHAGNWRHVGDSWQGQEGRLRWT